MSPSLQKVMYKNGRVREKYIPSTATEGRHRLIFRSIFPARGKQYCFYTSSRWVEYSISRLLSELNCFVNA